MRQDERDWLNEYATKWIQQEISNKPRSNEDR